jgi:hypothetical protein
MFGLKARHALLQNATHGEERSKDDNSISGVCRSHGSVQR